MNLLRIRRALAVFSPVVLSMGACAPDEVGLDSQEVRTQLEFEVSTSPRRDDSSSSLPSSSATETSQSAESAQESIARAFDDLMTRRIECGRDPAACDVSALAADSSPLFGQLSELMARRVESGIVASDEGEVSYRIESVESNGVDRATVRTCLRDDTVLVIDEAVYDDSLYSARSEWTLVRVADEWLWSEERITEWVLEEDLCDES